MSMLLLSLQILKHAESELDDAFKKELFDIYDALIDCCDKTYTEEDLIKLNKETSNG